MKNTTYNMAYTTYTISYTTNVLCFTTYHGPYTTYTVVNTSCSLSFTTYPNMVVENEKHKRKTRMTKKSVFPSRFPSFINKLTIIERTAILRKVLKNQPIKFSPPFIPIIFIVCKYDSGN